MPGPIIRQGDPFGVQSLPAPLRALVDMFAPQDDPLGGLAPPVAAAMRVVKRNPIQGMLFDKAELKSLPLKGNVTDAWSPKQFTDMMLDNNWLGDMPHSYTPIEQLKQLGLPLDFPTGSR